MQTCRHADMQTCRHADMQTCRHAGMHRCIDACMHAYIHTYTLIDSYIADVLYYGHSILAAGTGAGMPWLVTLKFLRGRSTLLGLQHSIGARVKSWIRLIHVGEYYHHWQLYIEPLQSAFEHRQNLPECTLRISKTLGLVRWHTPLLQNTMLKPWRKLFHASGASNSYAF